jgi:transcriptional regulator with XRE-family HTH domain
MSSPQPSASQIRAALGLIGWENRELAAACNVTAQSISNIKLGVTRPHPRILSAIRLALESQGIEFLENDGVRKRPEGVEVLNGVPGMQKFWDLVYAFAQTTENIIIRQNGIPEGPLDACAPGPAAKQRERMSDLVHRRTDIFARAIIDEGDFNFLCSSYFDYRWNPKKFPPTVPYYVFGDSVGIFTFDTDPPPKIILITSPTIARAYRTQFDTAWDLSIVPPKS